METFLTGPNATVTLTIFSIVLVFSFFVLLVRRYKRCPSNRILVVYGKTADRGAAKCVHGGGVFVWPLIQDFAFLDLEPIQIEIPLQAALSLENIRVNVPSVFTVAIGTEPATMNNAAVRLLNLPPGDIEAQARDIIFGQLRQVIASMQIEEINRDRESFLESIQNSLEPELRKIGLILINVNITDITDESGYIEAIGRKAAATAIQQAEIDVAEQEKKGAVGVAVANQEKAIQVAVADKEKDIGTKDAEREMTIRVADLDRESRIGVADANAGAVQGENEAQAVIAQADATLQVEQAEAYQRGETRKRVAEADVLRAQYDAEAVAAHSMAEKIEAERTADLVAPARARKAETVVQAEAEAERRRIEAEGDAKAIYARLEAEARGQFEILAKKGQGFGEIVDACGGPQAAFQMLMLEHLDNLSENASKAIQNIKFDKIVVWDGGGKDGGATSGFLNGLAGSLPPMLHMMRDIGGVEMPEFWGKMAEAARAAEDGEDHDDAHDEPDGPDEPDPPKNRKPARKRAPEAEAASLPAPEPDPEPDPGPEAAESPEPEATPEHLPEAGPVVGPEGGNGDIEVVGGEEWPPIEDLGPDEPDKG